MSLCYRCEHRARYLELNTRGNKGPRPRHQCGDIERSVISCYMYRPVKPVVLTKDPPDDLRPMFGPFMVSARSQFERLALSELKASIDADLLKLRASRTDDGVVLYWDCVPETFKHCKEIWLPFRYRLLWYQKFEITRIDVTSLFWKIIYKITDIFECVANKIWLLTRGKEEEDEEETPDISR